MSEFLSNKLKSIDNGIATVFINAMSHYKIEIFLPMKWGSKYSLNNSNDIMIGAITVKRLLVHNSFSVG